MRVVFCESCGAPLDAAWTELVVICRSCSAPSQPAGPVPLVHPDDGRPRLSVDGRTYLVEARLADGESSRVFRARWVARLGELVVLKVQRAAADGDLLRREHDVLRQLQRAPGGDGLARRLPAPIALGPLRDPFAGTGSAGPLSRAVRQERLVAVHGWRPGFVHTLEDVARAHPSGVPGPVAVWLLKRLLEALAFVHGAGLCHNALTPAHVLVHPRDHGAVPVGFSLAGPPGARVAGVVTAASHLLPPTFARDRVAHPRWDVAMATIAVATVSRPTGAVGALFERLARGEEADAWAARAALDAAALATHGPPRYAPLPMPGWAHQN